MSIESEQSASKLFDSHCEFTDFWTLLFRCCRLHYHRDAAEIIIESQR